jgi:hypothetical protein
VVAEQGKLSKKPKGPGYRKVRRSSIVDLHTMVRNDELSGDSQKR